MEKTNKQKRKTPRYKEGKVTNGWKLCKIKGNDQLSVLKSDFTKYIILVFNSTH